MNKEIEVYAAYMISPYETVDTKLVKGNITYDDEYDLFIFKPISDDSIIDIMYNYALEARYDFTLSRIIVYFANDVIWGDNLLPWGYKLFPPIANIDNIIKIPILALGMTEDEAILNLYAHENARMYEIEDKQNFPLYNDELKKIRKNCNLIQKIINGKTADVQNIRLEDIPNANQAYTLTTKYNQREVSQIINHFIQPAIKKGIYKVDIPISALQDYECIIRNVLCHLTHKGYKCNINYDANNTDVVTSYTISWEI